MFYSPFGLRKPLPLFSLFLLALAALIFSCNKGEEFIAEEAEHPPATQLTLDNLKSIYGSGGYATDRSNGSSKRLPLDATPIWSETTLKLIDGHPLFLVNAGEPVTLPDTEFRGNLGFFKNSSGEIESCLFLWKANLGYSDKFAPLLPNSNFSGDVIAVSEQDSIKALVKLSNGLVTQGGKGSYYFFDFPGAQEGGADDRDPRTGCYSWGTTGWQRFWNGVGNALGNVGTFFSNVWDDIVGHTSIGAGGFVFGTGNGSGTGPTGGGLVFDPNFTFPGSTTPEINLILYNQQLTVCASLQDAMNSTGEVPAGIGQGDVDFCNLMGTGVISRETGIMLMPLLNTSVITEINNIVSIYGNGDNVRRIVNACLNQYLIALTFGGEVSVSRLAELTRVSICANLNDNEIGYLFSNPQYISLMAGEMDGNQCGENGTRLQQVLRFTMSCGFPVSTTLFDQMLSNSNLFNAIKTFREGCSNLDPNGAMIIAIGKFMQDLNFTPEAQSIGLGMLDNLCTKLQQMSTSEYNNLVNTLMSNGPIDISGMDEGLVGQITDPNQILEPISPTVRICANMFNFTTSNPSTSNGSPASQTAGLTNLRVTLTTGTPPTTNTYFISRLFFHAPSLPGCDVAGIAAAAVNLAVTSTTDMVNNNNLTPVVNNTDPTTPTPLDKQIGLNFFNAINRNFQALIMASPCYPANNQNPPYVELVNYNELTDRQILYGTDFRNFGTSFRTYCP